MQYLCRNIATLIIKAYCNTLFYKKLKLPGQGANFSTDAVDQVSLMIMQVKQLRNASMISPWLGDCIMLHN